MASDTPPLRLFEGHGIEIEYMIVDQALNVAPAADDILHALGAGDDGDVDLGAVTWSNELALHVLEIKTSEPVPSLAGVAREFQDHIGMVNTILAKRDCRLMPTAMHPWMDPLRETVLWPHDHSPVYKTFDRIFGCQGHGWSNLQSMHINLPFGDDEEFARLHAAIRLLLPLMPALAASSPMVEGRLTGILDNRLDFYRLHVKRIPSVIGDVVPEPVFSRADYEQRIFERIHRDIAPHDSEGVLRDEWTNARGAIARFDRQAIEIRVIDSQECPAADLAIAEAIVHAVRNLVEECTCSLDSQKKWQAAPLRDLLFATMRDADETPITNADYLAAFGINSPATAREVWLKLLEDFSGDRGPLDHILTHGTLSRRIVRALGAAPIPEVYGRLCDCLARGELFA